MKSLYALHKDRRGKVLGAHSFDDDYSLRMWVGKLDLRDGDTIAFGEKAERPEFDEVEPLKPAFLNDDKPLDIAIATVAATASAEQPF